LEEHIDIESAALEYIERGFSIIPIKKGTKESRIKWREYQQRQPRSDEVDQWFKQWPEDQIALVTGMVSGIAVIDADGPAGIQWLKKNLPATSVYQKTHKGWHAFYKLNSDPVNNKTRIFPEIDIRGQGGYVLISPSVHPNGTDYKLVFPIESQGWDDLTEFPYDLIARAVQKNYLTLQPADEGERNDTLARIVGKYISKNLNFEEVLNLCTGWNLSCLKPLKQKELETTVRSIFKTHYNNHPLDIAIPSDNLSSMSSMSSIPVNLGQTQAKSSTGQAENAEKRDVEELKKSVLDFNLEIRSWILEQTGIIRNFDIDQEFCLKTRQEKNARSYQLNYLKKLGKIASVKNKTGHWRVLENNLVRQNPLSVKAKPYKIPMALGIYELVDIYPKNIILVSGSPNSGKTTFALNLAFFCAMLDCQAPIYIYNLLYSSYSQAEPKTDPPDFCLPNGPIRYFNSEMDETELSKRISAFPESDVWTKKVEFYERTSNFQDVIDPNGINIIDYLSIYENFWEVGVPIKEIHESLKTGIALICLQKKPGAEFAKGGAVTLEIPRLVINMDNNSPFGGIAKIAKAKAWATKNNPNGLERDYKIVDSWKIVSVSDWQYVSEKDRIRINKKYESDKSGDREYAYELRLEDGELAGLNFRDRQAWIEAYPNINVDYELTNLKKKLEFRSWLKKKNWFFQVGAYLKNREIEESQGTMGESG
jgi:hypothetical protein